MNFIFSNNNALLHLLSIHQHFNLFQNNTKQEILSLHPTISCRRYPLTLTSVSVPRKVSIGQQWTTELPNGWNDLKYIWSLCHFQVAIMCQGNSDHRRMTYKFQNEYPICYIVISQSFCDYVISAVHNTFQYSCLLSLSYEHN